ncbi:MAG TPA: PAS domain S-box protein [Acidobacteriaceae bacterium]|nr:PAS domain S-box protein [Chloroflexota bacterium]HLI76438.1 PAS domain S-box protein [Acidobacteriaceae bacterium]
MDQDAFSPSSDADQLRAELRRLRQQVAALERDVAQRNQVETALRASAERFRTLVEHSPDAIVLLDTAGIVLYLSPSTSRVLGYLPEELVGRSAFELIHPEDYELATRAFAELLQRPGQIVIRHVRARHKDGSWRWLESASTNLLHEPATGAIVANYRDITERKRVEEDARQAEREKARLEGIALAAREVGSRLNNNLAVARGTLELIQQSVALAHDLDRLARGAEECLLVAIEDVAKPQRVVRVETKDTVIGPVLDLERSAQ